METKLMDETKEGDVGETNGKETPEVVTIVPEVKENGLDTVVVDNNSNGGSSSSNGNGAGGSVGRRAGAKMFSKLQKRPPVNIGFTDLGLSVIEGGCMARLRRGGGRKSILKGVSGEFRSGELVAIMGPSGAGKSTLMNVLAGYKVSSVTGSITINGKPRNLRSFRKKSCYIMQDDCLCPHLTVEEAMWVASDLKLGEKTTRSEKARNMDEILDNLSLSACRTTRTIDLSGGQRKRLAIALELVNNPPVMFFDEPTSGLDSSSCAQCISLLKQLASEGRTIICTIHQPSARIFEMFDKLFLLGEGKNIYHGSVKDLIPFLSSLGLDCPSYHNPADFVMEVATGDYGRHLENMVEAAADPKWSTNCNSGEREKRWSSAFTEQSAPSSKETTPAPSDNSNNKQPTDAVAIQMSSSLKPGDNNEAECEQFLLGGSLESMDSGSGGSFPTTTCTQFRILFVRTFKSIVRDRTLTQLRLISHIGVGFLLGLLYWKIGNEASKVYNNSAMLFFCMLFSMFASMMPTVMTFPLEMATFKREHLNYWYSMKSYYLAKTMADMPFQIAFPVLFTAIVYTMTAQPFSVERVSMFVLMCVLTSLVAQSMGLVIGCASDIQTAVYLGPICTIPILLFSGFFVNLNNIPTVIHWLTYIAYVRYGFQGAMLAIYGFDRAPLHCSTGYCHYKYPVKWLEQMDMDGGAFWICVVALCVSFIVLRLVGYFVLRFKVWSER